MAGMGNGERVSQSLKVEFGIMASQFETYVSLHRPIWLS